MAELHCDSAACPACPYAISTPPGIWHESEYEKLRRYDEDTFAQPAGVFMCHQKNGNICAGWVAVHGSELLGLRMAFSRGDLEYPLPEIQGEFYESGNEAADAGLLGVMEPSVAAVKAIGKIERSRSKK